MIFGILCCFRLTTGTSRFIRKISWLSDDRMLLWEMSEQLGFCNGSFIWGTNQNNNFQNFPFQYLIHLNRK